MGGASIAALAVSYWRNNLAFEGMTGDFGRDTVDGVDDKKGPFPSWSKPC